MKNKRTKTTEPRQPLHVEINLDRKAAAVAMAERIHAATMRHKGSHSASLARQLVDVMRQISRYAGVRVDVTLSTEDGDGDGEVAA